MCHKCDVPSCVNPDHLFVATHAENMADMARKGRNARAGRPGEPRTHRKLTYAQAIQIRDRLASGDSRRALAVEFSVTPKAISNIERRRYWAPPDAAPMIDYAEIIKTLADALARELALIGRRECTCRQGYVCVKCGSEDAMRLAGRRPS